MRGKKLTIKEMQILARERGGKCLSQEYVNNREKLLWECVKGHQWRAAPDHVKTLGQWCSACAGVKKLTLQDMQILARERGGKCLSQKYVNNYTKLLWECDKGHQWEAKSIHVREGTWCSVCAGVKKLTLQEMQMLARERRGKCLSQKYVDAHTKLLWECAKGHQWEAKPTNIKSRGQWCPICYKIERANQSKLKAITQI